MVSFCSLFYTKNTANLNPHLRGICAGKNSMQSRTRMTPCVNHINNPHLRAGNHESNTMNKIIFKAALLITTVSLACSVHAALVKQDDGTVLDNVKNLLWFTARIDRNWTAATNWSANRTTGSLTAGSWSLASISQFNSLAAAAGAGYENYLNYQAIRYTQFIALGFQFGNYFLKDTVHTDAIVVNGFFIQAFY